ncbi:unnamed protein product, partial [Cochlearia groenlandica]
MSIVVCQSQDKIVTKNQLKESFTQKGDMAGLSFLQSMSDITANVRNKEDKAYVHPIKKGSISKLNEKSLEMCTESLGAETGSESGDELSLLVFEADKTPRAHSPKQRPQEDTNLLYKKSTMSVNNKSFPPPIKFVEGSKYNRMVRSIGEDGRLVVQAVRVSSPPRCFTEERGEGRLRLCLSPESSLLRLNHDDDDDEEKEEEETEEEYIEGKTGNKKSSRLSSGCKDNSRGPTKPILTWRKQHHFGSLL